MYRDIILFNNGGMILKHISDISIYIIRVSHIDLFVAFDFVEYTWALHVSKSKRGAGDLYECISDCLQNSFDGIFILSDKVAFMSGAA